MPDNPDQKVSFSGKVLDYDPPHRLRTTWPSKDGGDTYVTFTLKAQGNQVQLEVLHENITDRDDLIGASAGWHVHLDILDDKISGKTPAPFWETHTKLETQYEAKFP